MTLAVSEPYCHPKGVYYLVQAQATATANEVLDAVRHAFHLSFGPLEYHLASFEAFYCENNYWRVAVTQGD